MVHERHQRVISSSSSSEDEGRDYEENLEDKEYHSNEEESEAGSQSEEDGQSNEQEDDYNSAEDKDYEPGSEEDDAVEELEPELADDDEEGMEPLYHPHRYGIHLQTEEQQRAWARLAVMNIYPTRYPCAATTMALGIHDDVWGLINQIGWNHALAGGWSTYLILVYEFLSTLEVQASTMRGPHTMTFQLGGVSRILTAAEVNNIFNVPPGGIFNDFPVTTEAFWQQLQTEMTRFDHKRVKASMMPNPVFRYLQKIFTSTVLARHETSGMRSPEVLFLYCMLSAHNLNFAAFLMQQLKRQSTQATDAIEIGGMITPIAAHFGIPLNRYGLLPETRLIDLTTLRNSRMLATRTDRFLLHLCGSHCFPLPNRPLTTVSDLTDTRNWLMDSLAHRQAIDGVANEGRTNFEVFEAQGHVHMGESSAQAVRRGHTRTRDERSEDQWDSLTQMMANMNTAIGSMNNAVGTLTTNYGAMNNVFQTLQIDMHAMRGEVHEIRDAVRGLESAPGYYPNPFFDADPSGPSQHHEPTSSGRSQSQSQQRQMPPHMYPYIPYGYPPYRPPPSS
ncbi:hypothetical protein C2S51_000669 [Perilla frutescens var. frutescens]|nr:hypothetical protein C2S51_000669 [Perilla frutescens var. frutescens]